MAIEVLFKNGLHADVVRECQEACELALKSLIRDAGHSVPMLHDVSAKLREIREDLSEGVKSRLDRLCEISKQLRRDREMAFYGSEDITPSDFFDEKDARSALAQLDEVLAVLPDDKA
jgi:HEPN domain-containing protein